MQMLHMNRAVSKFQEGEATNETGLKELISLFTFKASTRLVLNNMCGSRKKTFQNS